MFQRLARTARTVAAGLRSVVAPAALVRSLDDTVTDPADVYSDEEMPTAEAIEEAAAAYTEAADQARAADRRKRQAKKVLGRLPAGLYGRFLVERTRTSRQTPDLESIRATYQRLGLGPVPMKDCAASLRITEAIPAAEVEPVTRPVLVAA
ncbi:hypothetical protein R6L23_22485 [Streptomyces sp. SR27]|uniref:hypothetical protein n=1 Tax=Streptomyces sp. SR27 TaxID=3076630 RepID=UPI00295B6F5A|nr:hypothetical protein [Streptomyces sp. SR27]MDV9190945.1 hypothetical protein [Streptomyces sp. SR27]